MSLQYTLVSIDNLGHMALSERPKLTEIPLLKTDCTRVVTILASKGEQAHRIGNIVLANDMSWNWVKVNNATTMTDNEKKLFKFAIKSVVVALQQQENVLIHCSAGLHRTGIFAYCVLRNLGFDEQQSLMYLQQLRVETYIAFTDKFKQVADDLCRTFA